MRIKKQTQLQRIVMSLGHSLTHSITHSKKRKLSAFCSRLSTTSTVMMKGVKERKKMKQMNEMMMMDYWTTGAT